MHKKKICISPREQGIAPTQEYYHCVLGLVFLCTPPLSYGSNLRESLSLPSFLTGACKIEELDRDVWEVRVVDEANAIWFLFPGAWAAACWSERAFWARALCRLFDEYDPVFIVRERVVKREKNANARMRSAESKASICVHTEQQKGDSPIFSAFHPSKSSISQHPLHQDRDSLRGVCRSERWGVPLEC